VSPGESRARVCGWVPSAGQVSLSVSVGWGDTTFYATRLRVNRGGADECRAPREKAIREGRQWAQSIFAEGDRTFVTFLARLVRGG